MIFPVIFFIELPFRVFFVVYLKYFVYYLVASLENVICPTRLII
jgi:hypothetical protein